MNKHVVSTLSVMLLGASTALYADNCTNDTDATVCDGSNTPSLQVPNNAKLNRTTIQNELTVGGNLNATESAMGALQVKGNADIKRSTVFSMAVIGGDFSAKDSSLLSLTVQGKTKLENSNIQKQSTYNGDLSAESSNLTDSVMLSTQVSLNHSSASHITMKTANAVVCLDHSSVGELRFVQGDGSVYKDKNSNVVTLSGGRVVTGDCPLSSKRS